MLTRRLAWLAGLLALFSVLLRAQETPSPTAPPAVQVRTAQGTAVPGATLKLTELATGRTWVSWTDENGRLDLPGLPPGKFRIEVEQIGFEPASKETELPAPGAIELGLRIAPPGAPAEAPTPTAPASGAKPSEQPSGPGPPGKTSAENTGAAPAKPGTTPSSGAQRPAPRADMAELIRQRMRQGGFQQVDPTGQAGGSTPDATSPADIGPLGEASSSDAFLISGTVGRGGGAGDAGGAFGGMSPFGGFGGPGDGNPFGGQPGQPGNFEI